VKKHLIALILILCALSLLPAGAEAVQKKTVEELIEERSSQCWVEGVQFGDDLILGSRGTVTFTMLDRKLSAAIANDGRMPEWLKNFNQYYGSQETKKKAVFIAQVTANKPWYFEYRNIFVGKYRLQKGDIVSYGWEEKIEIPTDQTGRFVFAVPESEVPAGEKVKLGYGEDFAEWRAPK
jgi:hypothetical protein